MKSCIFRCLTEQDYYILSNFGFIPCGLSEEFNGRYLRNECKLGNIFDDINRHLTHGSAFYSSWISCSKSFITDVEKYSLSTKKYEFDYRPYIAVIRHHDHSNMIMDYSVGELERIIHDANIVTPVDLFRELKANRIQKLVLNVSNREEMLSLFHCGLLRNYDGRKSFGGAMALNYAKASDEILVFRDIPIMPKDKMHGRPIDKTNIPVILSPLAYDILYSLIKRGSIKEDNQYYILCFINSFVKNIDNFYDLLTDNEKDFYRLHYYMRYQMRTILKLFDSNKIDYQSLFYVLNILKATILKKVINRYNEKYSKNYCTEPYLLYRSTELIDNNKDCCDVDLVLGRSKILIKSQH